MIIVEEAEKIILSQAGDYGAEIIPFELAAGRVLAENIKADRDLPPFNRVTMDGIAVNFDAIEAGNSTFKIKATQAAGDEPVEIEDHDQCIEIMTGAVLPGTADTIIRYEDLELRAGLATLVTHEIKRGQNIHYKGRDKKQNDVVASIGQLITPALISMVASVGETELRVQKLPRVAILSSGDELVDVGHSPEPHQIRLSNSYAMKAVLREHQVDAVAMHLPDDPEVIRKRIKNCLENYDVILLSGGISMGKFDYIPKALEELGVEQLFYKVQQRPGKPFWFGKHPKGQLIFAFPGNPVAAFMCVHRYFLPWLNASLGKEVKPQTRAVLNGRVSFPHPLKYFLQVKLHQNEYCQLVATPVEGNGSGDFANLTDIDAFMELPSGRNEFKKGEVFTVWPIV
ncbi:molybdopterin molybdotransferase MoeA [Mucilaginibacter sp. L3T2-6]|uniref:molybdopterin molybdotransferase MoeA n=1 Tax=Mucilaginibacter sp. L3T2-6 TaxID=3062491 RepID=UPI002675CB82|nr:molybdopterin molybdotransferase MoeA [Mucilaginibacter sp. L3T2-6]MDO3641204.1 molybdopterin molybdotransferase MoeA [Mucilaginibacter sp. L3T2-6]MDV6213320.1 molybdopterin molybdotransferase MoeA [Mucilaginibacter sp. L3T2-6]